MPDHRRVKNRRCLVTWCKGLAQKKLEPRRPSTFPPKAEAFQKQKRELEVQKRRILSHAEPSKSGEMSQSSGERRTPQPCHSRVFAPGCGLEKRKGSRRRKPGAEMQPHFLRRFSLTNWIRSKKGCADWVLRIGSKAGRVWRRRDHGRLTSHSR